jgi:hypothetical protein
MLLLPLTRPLERVADPTAPHRRDLRALRARRQAAWIARLLRRFGHRSSRLRTLSTGVPSRSGTAVSRA